MLQAIAVCTILPCDEDKDENHFGITSLEHWCGNESILSADQTFSTLFPRIWQKPHVGEQASLPTRRIKHTSARRFAAETILLNDSSHPIMVDDDISLSDSLYCTYSFNESSTMMFGVVWTIELHHVVTHDGSRLDQVFDKIYEEMEEFAIQLAMHFRTIDVHTEREHARHAISQLFTEQADLCQIYFNELLDLFGSTQQKVDFESPKLSESRSGTTTPHAHDQLTSTTELNTFPQPLVTPKFHFSTVEIDIPPINTPPPPPSAPSAQISRRWMMASQPASKADSRVSQVTPFAPEAGKKLHHQHQVPTLLSQVQGGKEFKKLKLLRGPTSSFPAQHSRAGQSAMNQDGAIVLDMETQSQDFNELKYLRKEDDADDLDYIASNVAAAKDYCETGAFELRQAEGYQRKGRNPFAVVQQSLDMLGEATELGDETAEIARPKKKKRTKIKIDDVFADMENAFNGLASIMFVSTWTLFQTLRETLRCSICSCTVMPIILAVVACLTLVSYALVASCFLSVILPACFVLLVVRTTVVERNVENFAARQQVLSTETIAQKSCRCFSLVARSVPMLFILVGYPLLAVYYIIPKYKSHVESTAGLAVGFQICVIVVLQILGTIRAMHSHKQRKDQILSNSCKRIEGITWKEQSSTAASAQIPPADRAFRFRWRNVGNVLACVTLLIETLQLAMFSMQVLIPSASIVGDVSAGFISSKIMPALYISLSQLVNTGMEKVYVYFGCIITAALLLLFLLQFMTQVYRFGRLKASGRNQEANELFFYSFVGSIIYGHGEMKGVSRPVSVLVTLLSDTLFIVVCSKLLLVLTCVDDGTGGAVMLINSSVVCWQGQHSTMAALSLICFSVYLPLCAMIAPMLSESGDGDNSSKDVSFLKPYLSVITVAKCIMIVAGTFFGHNAPVSTIVVTAIMLFVLFIITNVWTSQPATRSYLLHQRVSTESGETIGATVCQIRGGLGEPCFPPAFNVWRSISFLGGVWGALAALAAYNNPSAFSGDIKFGLLFAGLALIMIGGVVWYALWRIQNSVAVRYIPGSNIPGLKLKTMQAS